jgi:integrase
MVRQRADGRWEARVELGWREGKRRQLTRYGKTRRDAVENLRRAQADHDRGLSVTNGRATVGQYLERWLAQQQRADKAPNTVAQYEWAVKHHLIPAIGRKRLTELSADDVDDFLGTRANAGAARSTLVRLRAVLVMALDQAVRRDLIARNVAAFTDVPAGPVKEGRSLTADQARTLLESIQGGRLEAVYVTMLMLGLRPGEALGLAWAGIDLDRAEARIHQAVKAERGRVTVGALKTRGSRRTLALPAPVVEALRARRLRQLEERVAVGPAWVDTGLVFTTSIGTAIDPSNFRRAFSRATVRAGLGHWHPHELRHSAVSLLSAAGVRLEDVADVVGHATTRMTQQVYRHQVTPTISTGKDAMDRLFGGQAGGQVAAVNGAPSSAES